MKKIVLVLALLSLLLTHSCGIKATSQSKQETKVIEITDETRMEWWSQARFGMFIHWGIYTKLAGFYNGEAQPNSAEWIMNRGKIPIAEYEKLANDFNPNQFNAKEFVGLAKQAGMKYMVITAKHHDGFSMFDSKASDYNIVDATPFKRDVLKELAKECQIQGLKFGFYYSQAQDWHHPGGMGNNWDNSIKRVTSDEYVYEKALPEVKQLLTEYGSIAVFWWDTPREMTKSVVDSLHHITTALQPKIITNDRLGDDYPGDHKTFERHGPRRKPDAKYWELCQPISGSWGYRSDDNKFKSKSILIRNLIDQSSKGGNYLLNVSPTHEGTLKTEAVDRLQAIGTWMSKNNEAIYNTQASPTTEEPNWGRITMKVIDNKGLLYLHVYDWEAGKTLPVDLKNKVESCYLLTDPSRVFKTETGDNGIEVKLAGEAPDSVASVIVLKLKDMPNAFPQKALSQDENGIVILPAFRAQFENLQGPGAQYNERLDCVSSWDSETARVYWTFNIDTPGDFKLTGAFSGKIDSEITMLFNGVNKNIKVLVNGNPKKFAKTDLGTFNIEESGEFQVSFMPKINNWNAINLKEVKLETVKK